MEFPQPKVSALPQNTSLRGKTVAITGATAGIGLETARQMLRLQVSHLILAVRNVSKGLDCKREIQPLNVETTITVLQLNMEDYKSVQSFAQELRNQVPSLDILLLNAGIGLLKFEKSPSGHERVMQVNYLSNVLLIAELLPFLKESAQKNGRPSRITWVGSRMYFSASFEKQAPIKADESVLEHMNSAQFFFPDEKYNDTKLLCAMFMYSLASRLDKNHVTLNMVCPGLVNTSMTDILPFHKRMFMAVFKAVLARPVEVGGRLFVHAAAVAGQESHGKLLAEMKAFEPSPYLLSPAGQIVQKKLWSETVKEMEKLTKLPSEFSS